jgi:hypothetical protein
MEDVLADLQARLVRPEEPAASVRNRAYPPCGVRCDGAGGDMLDELGPAATNSRAPRIGRADESWCPPTGEATVTSITLSA